MTKTRTRYTVNGNIINFASSTLVVKYPLVDNNADKKAEQSSSFTFNNNDPTLRLLTELSSYEGWEKVNNVKLSEYFSLVTNKSDAFVAYQQLAHTMERSGENDKNETLYLITHKPKTRRYTSDNIDLRLGQFDKDKNKSILYIRSSKNASTSLHNTLSKTKKTFLDQGHKLLKITPLRNLEDTTVTLQFVLEKGSNENVACCDVRYPRQALLAFLQQNECYKFHVWDSAKISMVDGVPSDRMNIYIPSQVIKDEILNSKKEVVVIEVFRHTDKLFDKLNKIVPGYSFVPKYSVMKSQNKGILLLQGIHAKDIPAFAAAFSHFNLSGVLGEVSRTQLNTFCIGFTEAYDFFVFNRMSTTSLEKKNDTAQQSAIASAADEKSTIAGAHSAIVPIEMKDEPVEPEVTDYLLSLFKNRPLKESFPAGKRKWVYRTCPKTQKPFITLMEKDEKNEFLDALSKKMCEFLKEKLRNERETIKFHFEPILPVIPGKTPRYLLQIFDVDQIKQKAKTVFYEKRVAQSAAAYRAILKIQKNTRAKQSRALTMLRQHP